ncbi:hypothetical protein [Flavobacterium sp. UBA4197]|uniref:hypothetical protein n=1 Tax=Flavobacterium sp. UBA4197 TaxID=1946546 RepID=UPI00257F9018|nr:hypothetical protein [Flavobacterium sp. UBA4197]
MVYQRYYKKPFLTGLLTLIETNLLYPELLKVKGRYAIFLRQKQREKNNKKAKHLNYSDLLIK